MPAADADIIAVGTPALLMFLSLLCFGYYMANGLYSWLESHRRPDKDDRK